MELRQVLDAVPGVQFHGDAATEVNDLAYNSRSAGAGSLYFCVRGERSDGHLYADDARRSGAAALVADHVLDVDLPQAIVADVRASMAPAAVSFFDDPTAELAVVGITGTNGKTTTAFLVQHVLAATGRSTGLLGTVTSVIAGSERPVVRTTPEAVDLQRSFRAMLDGGDSACAMEVSSHALVLGRAEGTRFEVAVFTNLTQDHLDFHGEMEDYFAAKRLLFLGEAPPKAAVVNIDDSYGARLAAEIETAGRIGRLVTYSASGDRRATLRAAEVGFDASGSRFQLAGPFGEAEVVTALPGHFNVANSLAAIGAVSELGVGPDVAIAALAGAPRVPGRVEPIEEGQSFAVLVDYAHTPDSLENVLAAARRLTPDGRVISVFGCGGDRDRDKRPLMGEISARLADLTIVTSDNPRSEDPRAILDEIARGIPAGAGAEYEVDRRAAIARSFELAASGDTVVIAGKGHESGQEFAAGRKVPFDDREVAREELRRRRTSTAVGAA